MNRQTGTTIERVRPLSSEELRLGIDTIEGRRTSVPEDWLPHARRQLRKIASLQSNWDGEGALQPSEAALEAAEEILSRLRARGLIYRPHVNPTRDGAVQLEGEGGGQYVEIELRTAEEIGIVLQTDAGEEPRDARCTGAAALEVVVAMVIEVLGACT